MKIQIRRGVFETNSSSTHSLTMCTRAEFDAWKDGQMYYNYDNDALVSVYDPEVLEHFKSLEEEYGAGYNRYDVSAWELQYLTIEEFLDNCYETFESHYTTPGGEEVVAFGYYGEDC